MPREKKTYAVRIAACEASEQRALAEAKKFHERKLSLIADAKADAAALLAQVGAEKDETTSAPTADKTVAGEE